MGRDKVGTQDQVLAGLSTNVVPPAFPCPNCGKETKDANTKAAQKAGLQVRICSSAICRAHFEWSGAAPVAYDETTIPRDESDPDPTRFERPSALDEPQGPRFPCPNCGKETKDNNTQESKEAGLDLRICSSAVCRVKSEWSTNQGRLE